MDHYPITPDMTATASAHMTADKVVVNGDDDRATITSATTVTLPIPIRAIRVPYGWLAVY